MNGGVRGRRARGVAAAAWTIALLIGCGDEPPTATFVQPIYREPCRFIDCGNGTCTASAQGEPECLCDPGYTGAQCESCETGYHLDYYQQCAPDLGCGDQPTNPCGEYGTCDDSMGVIGCECDEGYEGPRCTLCADRYGRDELGRCLPIFFDPTPTDTGGPVTCDEGYTGSSCTECADGHHAFGAGCVPDDACEAGACPSSADCEIVDGVRACLCHTGYSGSDCDQCASGFHSEASLCVPDESCSATSCPPTATCDAQAGAVECTCVPGYDGDACDSCAVGYHPDGAGCQADEVCSPLECSARASCVVVAGETRCDCEAGWGGERCDRCIDLGTEIISFEGAQDWPTVTNTCATREELWVPRLSLRSRAGEEPLLICASNTYSGLTSQHVELRAGRATAQAPSLPAELVFWQPTVTVSFDYAATLKPIAIDVFADGTKVGVLDAAPGTKASFTVQLATPALGLTLVSRSGALMAFGLDNIVFHYERCR